MDKKLKCLICEGENLKVIEISERQSIHNKTYFQCRSCDVIFLSAECHLSAENEKNRYDLHQNNVLNQGYQDFVMPLKNEIVFRCNITLKGLDYGSGKDSAIAFLLAQSGYTIEKYDPFYNKNEGVLNSRKFDYIIVCEVAEHFYTPKAEFEKLNLLLKPDGFLFLLTSLKTAEIDFNSWSYRRDPTHVCFYAEKTFAWIARHLDLVIIKLERPNLIVLQKKDNS